MNKKVIWCLLLSLYVLIVCISIEVLNVKAGHILPNKDDGKWRVLFSPAMAWEMTYGPKDQNGNPVDRPLTHAEKIARKEFITQSGYEAILRDIVGSLGLLQYILGPIALVWALMLMRDAKIRWIRLVLILCAIGACYANAMICL